MRPEHYLYLLKVLFFYNILSFVEEKFFYFSFFDPFLLRTLCQLNFDLKSKDWIDNLFFFIQDIFLTIIQIFLPKDKTNTAVKNRIMALNRQNCYEIENKKQQKEYQNTITHSDRTLLFVDEQNSQSKESITQAQTQVTLTSFFSIFLIIFFVICNCEYIQFCSVCLLWKLFAFVRCNTTHSY